MRAGATSVLFPFVSPHVEQSSHSVVVEWMRELRKRFHRTSCCLWEVRAKKLLAWIENEQIKHHCWPRLCSQHGQFLLCRQQYSEWVTCHSAPNCHFPSWVCIFVSKFVYAYICISAYKFRLSSWSCSHSSQSLIDRWRHQQCLLNRATAKVTCVRNTKEQ